MEEIAAPPEARLVRWSAWGSRAVVLALLAATGCRGGEVPSHTAPAGTTASATAQDAGKIGQVCEWAAWMVDEVLAIPAEQAGAPISALLGSEAGKGCRITAVGSFFDLPEDVETPVDLLFEAFDDSGWHEDLRFASDTDESSAIGMWKGGILCVAGAVWTVSEEMESEKTESEEYEPTEEEMRYEIAVECAPAEFPPLFPDALT